MSASYLKNRKLWALVTRGFYFVTATLLLSGTSFAQDDPYAEPDEPGLPPSNMELDLS